MVVYVDALVPTCRSVREMASKIGVGCILAVGLVDVMHLSLFQSVEYPIGFVPLFPKLGAV